MSLEPPREPLTGELRRTGSSRWSRPSPCWVHGLSCVDRRVAGRGGATPGEEDRRPRRRAGQRAVADVDPWVRACAGDRLPAVFAGRGQGDGRDDHPAGRVGDPIDTSVTPCGASSKDAHQQPHSRQTNTDLERLKSVICIVCSSAGLDVGGESTAYIRPTGPRTARSTPSANTPRRSTVCPPHRGGARLDEGRTGRQSDRRPPPAA